MTSYPPPPAPGLTDDEEEYSSSEDELGEIEAPPPPPADDFIVPPPPPEEDADFPSVVGRNRSATGSVVGPPPPLPAPASGPPPSRALPQRQAGFGSATMTSPPSLAQVQAKQQAAAASGVSASTVPASAFAAALAAANAQQDASAGMRPREGSNAGPPARPAGRPSTSALGSPLAASPAHGSATRTSPSTGDVTIRPSSFSSSAFDSAPIAGASFSSSGSAAAAAGESGSFQQQRPRGREGQPALSLEREDSGSPFIAASSSPASSPSSSTSYLAATPTSAVQAPAGSPPAAAAHNHSALSSPFSTLAIAHTASSLTSAQDLGANGTKSFASALLHNFVGVSSQVEIGSYSVKRCASFLKKLALAQEEYSRTISKLLAHEQTKLTKLTVDHMALHQKSWVQLQDVYARVAKSHLLEANEIQNQLVAPLQEFYTQQEEARKGILLEERKISGEMTRAREEVAKGLKETTKLLDEAKAAMSATDKKGGAGGGSSGAASATTSFFKTLSMKVGRRPDQVIKEASKAASSYQAAIGVANKRQEKYLAAELPKLFRDMEGLERRRLDTIKARLLKFTATTATFAAERTALGEEARRAVETQKTNTDLSEFIEELLYEHGPSIAPRSFQYELPCTPADIDSGRLEGAPNSVFRVTLDHCMTLQKDMPAAAKLDVPRILPTLIARIRELGGYTELGIFRISVGKEDLDALRKQIDVDMNYNLENIKNPHICAALLKEWMRLLLEPVIPTDALYAQAIASVKSSAGATYDADAIRKLYADLPPLNQRVLRELSLMVRDISEPANADKSKMTVDNQAIVWAPSFLRNPSIDPQELMMNTKYETKFTASLFRVVGDIKWN